MKKIAIVTGSSSGLGLEIALLLAANNYTVYATMRNLKKQDELLTKATEKSVEVQVLQLDVTDQKSVDQCFSTITEKEGKIDLLINNAGGGFAKTTEHATEEEIKWVTDLNYFGVVRCTKAVIPIMRKNKSGFVINISSVGGLVGQPFNELYCASKFAVEGYTEGLASYLTDNFGIKFSIVEPGGISSEFMKSATAKTMTDGQITLPEYMPIMQQYLGGRQKRAEQGETQSFQTPAEVAEVVMQVVNTEHPPLRIRTSKWAEDLCNLKTAADPDGTKLVKAVKERFLG